MPAKQTPQATATASPSSQPASPRTDILIVRNGSLIDGTGGDPLPGAYVVVEGDRIASFGTGEPPAAIGATVIDARGGRIMPRLIDSHVHVARGMFAGDPGSIEPGGLTPWLSGGVATLRDVGTPPGAFSEVNQANDADTAAHRPRRVVWTGPL